MNKMNKKNKNIRINNKKTQKNKSNKGGKVFASGGFGCVFMPALKCQGTKKRENHKISKLMTEKHAKEEYQEIVSIKEKIDTIPEYKDYFLLSDINLCTPAPLTKNDLTNFKRCSALPKDNITKENINTKLSETMILNMPNGGIAIDDFLYESQSFESMQKINISLMNLLKKGVIPMNKKNVYHSDIKDSNILVDDSVTKLYTRLIDWGLTTEYAPFKNAPFPTTWRNRPFQFNVPFSVIIFSDFFIKKYTAFIEDGGKIEKESLKIFVVDFIMFWMKERGHGHYKFINEIMFMLFSKDLKLNDKTIKVIIETEFTMVYITDYIVDVLLQFTVFREDGTLNLREYLDNVFVKNVDIWGFCCSYFPFLELLFNNYDKLNENEKQLFDSLKEMFITIYTSSSKEININKIFQILQNVNTILEKMVSVNNTVSAHGIKKTKRATKIIKSSVSFRNKPKLKIYKNPLFLSLQ